MVGMQSLGCCMLLGGQWNRPILWFFNGDNGLLNTNTSNWTNLPGFIDWRNGARNAITYYQYYPPVNSVICNGGASTGYGCGIVSNNNATVTISDNTYGNVTLYNMILSTMPSGPGDSGGPVFTGDHQGAVGITSGGVSGKSATEPIWRPINKYGIWPYGG